MAEFPADLRPAAEFALVVAMGCAWILESIRDFIDGMFPRSPILEYAVAVAMVIIPVTYITAVNLMYIIVTPPAAAPAPGAARRVADFACFLAFVLLVALAAFLLLVAACSPSSSGSGFTPT